MSHGVVPVPSSLRSAATFSTSIVDDTDAEEQASLLQARAPWGQHALLTAPCIPLPFLLRPARWLPQTQLRSCYSPPLQREFLLHQFARTPPAACPTLQPQPAIAHRTPAVQQPHHHHRAALSVDAPQSPNPASAAAVQQPAAGGHVFNSLDYELAENSVYRADTAASGHLDAALQGGVKWSLCLLLGATVVVGVIISPISQIKVICCLTAHTLRCCAAMIILRCVCTKACRIWCPPPKMRAAPLLPPPAAAAVCAATATHLHLLHNSVRHVTLHLQVL
jgi:hypothetical protein